MKLKLKGGDLYVRKVFTGEVIERADGKPLVAIVSTEAVDSYGDIIHQGPTDKGRGWMLDRFNKSPRTYWMHDPTIPNLVTSESRAWLDTAGLMFSPAFDMPDTFAAELDRKYRANVLSEWSVGFRAVVRDPRGEGVFGEHFWEQTLMEVSAVNRGANPDTDTIAKGLGFFPEDIDDQEISAIALLKSELADYRAEFEQRLRAIEGSLMRGSREADDALAASDKETLDRIMQRMNGTLDKIEVRQS
jgi:hypothetical protein